MRRIGIDVGGTNTDGALLDGERVIETIKTPTTSDVLGGIRTVLQTSFFYETGSVSDNISRLHKKMKSSFGVGFRAIISGLIYRFDLAKGDEGVAPTLFINYPLSLGTLGS